MELLPPAGAPMICLPSPLCKWNIFSLFFTKSGLASVTTSEFRGRQRPCCLWCTVDEKISVTFVNQSDFDPKPHADPFLAQVSADVCHMSKRKLKWSFTCNHFAYKICKPVHICVEATCWSLLGQVSAVSFSCDKQTFHTVLVIFENLATICKYVKISHLKLVIRNDSHFVQQLSRERRFMGVNWV